MKGLVSCIKRYADASDYFLLLEDQGLKTKNVRSKIMLNTGDAADFRIEDGIVQIIEEESTKKDIEIWKKEAGKAAETISNGKLYRSGVDKIDMLTEKMWKNLSAAAILLARKLTIAAPILIRFHNDIDGSSGAYAVYKAMMQLLENNTQLDYKPNIIWRMHGGVSYSKEDASNDLLVCNNYECIEKPLLMVLDFGTAEESNPGIEIVREKFDIIWLDHHPIIEKFAGRKLEHYVNPWNFGGDSNYTAGYLGCMFAKSLVKVDTKNLEGASLIGDYSEYAKPEAESKRLAVLLDLLTSDTRMAASMRGNLNPEDIDKIVNNKEKSDELIAYASNRVSEMLDSALKSVKIYKAKETNIYVADFEGVRGTSEERYPLPGRFASKLLDKIEELNKVPCILLVHFGYFISIRMSKKLIGEVNLLKALEEVRENYKDDVEASGGHSNAASIKLKKEDRKKAVIKSVVDKLKEMLEK